MSSYWLSHLKQLEAESIYIIREVAVAFSNPVMLYSIGKDSSVMVQLAMKAFYPAKPPFPLLHVDTTWKFREMIEFRENYARKHLGLDIHLEKIPIVPLYFAKERPVVRRNGAWIMVDDERLKLEPGETPQMKSVRFRTLGCYPLSGAVESTATTLPQIIQEMLLTKTSERQGRVIDQDEGGAGMEEKKKRGYF